MHTTIGRGIVAAGIMMALVGAPLVGGVAPPPAINIRRKPWNMPRKPSLTANKAMPTHW